MKVSDFNKQIAKKEGQKRQVSIAQIAEVSKSINELTNGEYYKMIRGLKKTALMLGFFLFSWVANAQIVPVNYWHFDGINTGTTIDDSLDAYNLNYASYGGTLPVTSGGQVGKYGAGGSSSALSQCSGSPFSMVDSMTVEFIFRAQQRFNTCEIFRSLNDAFKITFEFPQFNYTRPRIIFTTKNVGQGESEFSIYLDGIGRKNLAWLMDGNWHHMVFTYKSTTGQKKVYIDGECPSGFSTTAPVGTLDRTGAAQLFWFSNVTYRKCYMDIDEMAIYNRALPDNHVKEHYNNMKAGVHYSWTTGISSPVTPAAVSSGLEADDYPAGSSVVSVSYTVPNGFSGPNGEAGGGGPYNDNASTAPTLSFLNQLKTYPIPRYRPSHTMPPNIDWTDIGYAAGRGQTFTVTTTPALWTQISQSALPAIAKSISTEYAQNWNIAPTIGLMNGGSDFYTSLSPLTHANTVNGQIIKLLNDSSHFKAAGITLRIQIPGSLVWSQTLTTDKYLQISPTQFLDSQGNVTTGRKELRPSNTVSFFNADGLYIRARLQEYINAVPNRATDKKIDVISENGEWSPVYRDAALAADPTVNADKTASGMDWQTYQGRRYKELAKQSFNDQFMSLPGLAQTYYSEYAIDGYWYSNQEFRKKYQEVRLINSIKNGQYYSTGDFYPRWPYNWRNFSSAWHGLSWFSGSRINEIGLGDQFFSPFVSAGWYWDETENIRPGQYLGLLKILAGMGAEWYNNGFFNINYPFSQPGNWTYQAVLSSYAQAVVSHKESFFRNSKVMVGDYPLDYIANTDSSFLWYTKNLCQAVTIRKHNSNAQYMIFGTVQPNTNMTDTLTYESNATVQLPGVGDMTFKVRRQGSVYWFDYTDPANPIWYSMDDWHERKHPEKWSQDISLQAEMYTGSSGTLSTKTEGHSGLNFTAASSYVRMNTGATISFEVQKSELSSTSRYFWVRARSTNGAETGISIAMTGYSAKTIECLTSTTWAWYRIDKVGATPIVYTSMTDGKYTLTLTALNTIEIDKVVLEESAGDIYGETVVSCAGSVTATVSPAGPLTYCYNNPTALTASPGTSYLWSNGLTTQSITPLASGSYSCTVTVSGVGSGTSNTVVVTVNGVPNIQPIATQSNVCPSVTVDLSLVSVTNSGTAGTTTWHPTKADAIANTSAIGAPVGTAGWYYIRIETAAGCYDYDSARVVINNCGCGSPITVDAGVDQSKCAGSTFTINGVAVGGYASLSWASNGTGTFSTSTNDTTVYTPSAADISSGSVRLILTAPDPDAGGPCTADADTVMLTIKAKPGTTITGTTSFCSGSSTTLTAPTGAQYAWNTGATTASISVSTSGVYTVTVTGSNGCSATSGSVTTTANTLPVVAISAPGGLKVCATGSLALTATGNAASYLWSTGSTAVTITATTAGNYTVTGTSIAGCTKAATATVQDTCVGACVTPVNWRKNYNYWTTAKFSWDGPSGQSGFQVQLTNMATGVVTSANYAGTARYLNLSGLSRRTTYQIKLRTICSGTYSSWTNTISFTMW